HELPLQYVETQNFASLRCKFPLIKGGRGMSLRGLKPSVANDSVPGWYIHILNISNSHSA
ncbi:MAG TPA: hypothetical protein PKV40_09085, partial [Candidatus Kapabacteria bacterium]|nr:hypothetical protein [Candidatus Kapabacteria bacterium]